MASNEQVIYQCLQDIVDRITKDYMSSSGVVATSISSKSFNVRPKVVEVKTDITAGISSSLLTRQSRTVQSSSGIYSKGVDYIHSLQFPINRARVPSKQHQGDRVSSTYSGSSSRKRTTFTIEKCFLNAEPEVKAQVVGSPSFRSLEEASNIIRAQAMYNNDAGLSTSVSCHNYAVSISDIRSSNTGIAPGGSQAVKKSNRGRRRAVIVDDNDPLEQYLLGRTPQDYLKRSVTIPKGLRGFLIAHLELNDIAGTEWIDKDAKIFSAKWVRKNSPKCNVVDFELFKEWEKFKGRDISNFGGSSDWKTRIRCAFRKQDILEIPELRGVSSSGPEQDTYKVFKFCTEDETRQVKHVGSDALCSEELRTRLAARLQQKGIALEVASADDGSPAPSRPQAPARGEGRERKAQAARQSSVIVSGSPSMVSRHFTRASSIPHHPPAATTSTSFISVPMPLGPLACGVTTSATTGVISPSGMPPPAGSSVTIVNGMPGSGSSPLVSAGNSVVSPVGIPAHAFSTSGATTALTPAVHLYIPAHGMHMGAAIPRSNHSPDNYHVAPSNVKKVISPSPQQQQQKQQSVNTSKFVLLFRTWLSEMADEGREVGGLRWMDEQRNAVCMKWKRLRPDTDNNWYWRYDDYELFKAWEQFYQGGTGDPNIAKNGPRQWKFRFRMALKKAAFVEVKSFREMGENFKVFMFKECYERPDDTGSEQSEVDDDIDCDEEEEEVGTPLQTLTTGQQPGQQQQSPCCMCPQCRQLFHSQLEVMLHVQEDHTDAVEKYPCTHCAFKFASLYAVNEHWMKDHQDQPPPQPTQPASLTTGHSTILHTPSLTTGHSTTLPTPLLTTGHSTTLPTPSLTTGHSTTLPTPPLTTGQSTTLPTPLLTTGHSTTLPTPPLTTGQSTTLPIRSLTTGKSTTLSTPSLTTGQSTTLTTSQSTTLPTPSLTTGHSTTLPTPLLTTALSTTLATPLLTTGHSTTLPTPPLTTGHSTALPIPPLTTGLSTRLVTGQLTTGHIVPTFLPTRAPPPPRAITIGTVLNLRPTNHVATIVRPPMPTLLRPAGMVITSGSGSGESLKPLDLSAKSTSNDTAIDSGVDAVQRSKVRV